jgi:NAD(P)-dependent dehydrogenase (short-subunit alcohol dehydrogenase family)
MPHEGRVVLVSGGGGALGAAVVEAFAAADARVAVVDRVAYRGAAQVHAVVGAVTDEAGARAAVAEVVARHGRVDVLVNLVGGFAAGLPLAEVPVATWQHMMTLNLDSAFHMCRAALASMTEHKWGRIVNIGSRAAVEPMPQGVAYAVSKAAVVALTRNLAAEVKDFGITVNCILPSIIDTPANRNAMPDADFARWPKAEQLARIIMFLSSDDAAIVSGAALPVYGLA